MSIKGISIYPKIRMKCASYRQTVSLSLKENYSERVTVINIINKIV